MPRDKPSREHPFRCIETHVPFYTSKHEAKEFITQWKNERHFESCCHLAVHNFGDRFGNPIYYGPNCIEDSLAYSEDKYHNKLLQGCPKNCHYYRSEKKEMFSRCWRLFWQKLEKFSDRFIGWFTCLPWHTQGLLILIVIFLVFGHRAVSIIKAAKELAS
ncbi:MAG: hypothetical protein K0R66_1049 [Gammaproteobacteria bacterium]|jgi:hypothetical protein|nr:hypothetical protein [Gammaproteobacteria bacterium]